MLAAYLGLHKGPEVTLVVSMLTFVLWMIFWMLVLFLWPARKSAAKPARQHLFFIAYQRDPRTAFLPIMRNLARQDALNEYIRHVSSGSFACPPGISGAGDYWGRALFA